MAPNQDDTRQRQNLRLEPELWAEIDVARARRSGRAASKRALRKAGWRALVVWECQLKKPEAVAARLRRFLDR